MPREDFLRVLLSVVAPAEPRETTTLTGTVVGVDPCAGRVGLRPDNSGWTCGIQLPETYPTEDLALEDRLTVTGQGEPATFYTLWVQQLIDVQPANDT